MKSKILPAGPEELKGSAAHFFQTIEQESDRGCVLVGAGFLEEALELLLRSKMTKDPHGIKKSVNPLFDNALRSFWAKTELCHALGLLDRYQYSDLVLVRDLRNHFAHSYVVASFDSHRAKEIVSQLWHFGTKKVPPTPTEMEKGGYVRQRFSLAVSWIAGAIHHKAGFVEGQSPQGSPRTQ